MPVAINTSEEACSDKRLAGLYTCYSNTFRLSEQKAYGDSLVKAYWCFFVGGLTKRGAAAGGDAAGDATVRTIVFVRTATLIASTDRPAPVDSDAAAPRRA